MTQVTPQTKTQINKAIRSDDHLALGKCLSSVGIDDIFWVQDWPKLIFQCINNTSVACLDILIEGAKHLPSPPRLPDSTLNHLCLNIRQGLSKDLSSPWYGTVLADKIAESPQRITLSTWEMVLRSGGWWSGLGMNKLEDRLNDAPWYEKEKTRWLSSSKGRGSLVELLTYHATNRFWSEIFDDFWPHVPASHKKELSALLGVKLTQIDTQDDAKLTRVGDAYRFLSNSDGDVSTPEWKGWWSKRLDELWRPSRTFAIIALIRGAYANDPAAPPPGFTWNEKTTLRWSKNLGKMMLDDPSKTSVGINPYHEYACSAVMDIPQWLSGWGLWDASQQDVWEETLSQVNPRWVEVLTTPTPSLRSSSMYMEQLSAWKRQKLMGEVNSSIPPTPVPNIKI